MRKEFTKNVIQPSFESDLLADGNAKLFATAPFALLQLIAQVLDEAASGEDCFVSIGLTKQKTAAMVTLTLNGQRQYASGSDLASLLDSVKSLV